MSNFLTSIEFVTVLSLIILSLPHILPQKSSPKTTLHQMLFISKPSSIPSVSIVIPDYTTSKNHYSRAAESSEWIIENDPSLVTSRDIETFDEIENLKSGFSGESLVGKMA